MQLSIKNKYENELTGTLELEEDKKSLFNTAPYIKELTPTKMVIAFNFKSESEPSISNNFLGMSVPIDLKIYEKSSSRFLSSQTITANCNTPPSSIPEEKIVYYEDTDEYVVELPKIEGIHKDLKEVEFLLSSKYKKEEVKSKIIPVDEGTQGSLLRLSIKGIEDW